jgi:hypothetical protein
VRARARYPHLDFVLGDAKDVATLRAIEGPPDNIIISDTIGMFEDIDGTLRLINQVCAPSTRIIIFYYSDLWGPILKRAGRCWVFIASSRRSISDGMSKNARVFARRTGKQDGKGEGDTCDRVVVAAGDVLMSLRSHNAAKGAAKISHHYRDGKGDFATNCSSLIATFIRCTCNAWAGGMG